MMKKILLFISACFLMLSCKKVENTYKAEITIKTENEIPIPNANVRLDVPVDGAELYFTQTNEDGVAFFEIPAKAFYDVKTWKGTWRGCGYVEFIKGETVKKTVYIRTWGDPLNTCWD
jgi:hypothetical protein